MRDLFEFFSVILAIFLAIAIAFFGIYWFGNKLECSAFKDGTGSETRFVKGACFIKVDGKFVPMEQYKKSFERNLNLSVKSK